MERPLEGAALGRGHGRKPVPAEIAIPFTVFRVGKMLPAIVKTGKEPFQIALVKHQGGDQNFIMRPPQLHIMLICLRWLTAGINKVQETAVFLIPAGVDGVKKDVLRLLYQRLVTGTARMAYRNNHDATQLKVLAKALIKL